MGAGHAGPSPRWHGVFTEVFIEMVAVFRNNTEIPVYFAQFPPVVVVYETVTSVTHDTPAPCSGLPDFTWHPVVGAGMIFKSKSQQCLVRLNTQRRATSRLWQDVLPHQTAIDECFLPRRARSRATHISVVCGPCLTPVSPRGHGLPRALSSPVELSWGLHPTASCRSSPPKAGRRQL